MNGPDDELRAAEAEFQSNGVQLPDQFTSDSVRDETMAERHPSARPLEDVADHQPRKKLKLTEADKKRSARMFGALMQGTLSKFQDETKKTRQTDAAKRRAAVDNRLQAKLKVESEALHQIRAFEAEEKNLKHNTWRKAEELGHLTESTPIRFANTLAFSHYLRTSASNLKQADRTDPSPTAYARLRNQENQIYWLPHKLLPEQKELIESQRRAAREEVEEAQRRWDELRTQKQEELQQLQLAQDARLAAIEVEKAQSRLLVGSADPVAQTNTTDDLLPIKVDDAIEPVPMDVSEIRHDTPDAPNDIRGDEDAVEY